MSKKWIVQFDGGIKGGNPGGQPVYGIAILDDEKRVIHSLFGIITNEKLTNNIAEWTSLRNALIFTWANRDCFTHLEIRGDSQLVIRQLTGEYAVNAEHLKPLCETCRRVIENLRKEKIVVEPIWNYREHNTHADALANLAYKVYIERTAPWLS